jgi:lysophospholipase L1-like esterase
MTSRRHSEPSVGRKILFTALVVGCVCLAIEGVARIVWWRLERQSLKTHYMKGEAVLNNDAINYMKVPDGLYGYQLKPGFRNEWNSVNSQGFHQPDDVPVKRMPGSLRIVCLGESTTFGSTDQWNYPAFLRQILETRAIGFRHYEVINAGVPGWLSDQVALRVEHQIAQFKPDAAILYVGWNDFQSYDPRLPLATESSFALGFGLTPWRQYARSASRAVAILSALYERQRHPPTPADYREAEAHSTPPDQRYRFLVQHLDDIVHDLKAANPKTKIFVCTLVGLWPQGSPEAWTKMQVPWFVSHHKLAPEEAARYVRELNDQLRQFAATHDASLVDTAAIFDPLDRTRLQWDFAHMYADGYELMALSMFEALRASGLVKGDASRRYEDLLATYRLSSAATTHSPRLP